MTKAFQPMIEDIQQIKECPDCASPNIVHNMRRDQVICRECGLIYEPLTPIEEAVFEQTHNMRLTAAPASRVRAKKTARKPAKKAAKKAKKKTRTKRRRQ